jgi:hypothetical protein
VNILSAPRVPKGLKNAEIQLRGYVVTVMNPDVSISRVNANCSRSTIFHELLVRGPGYVALYSGSKFSSASCSTSVPRVRSALKRNAVPVIRHSRHVSASARLLPAGCRMKMMYVTPAVLFGCGSHIHLHDSKRVRGRDDVG